MEARINQLEQASEFKEGLRNCCRANKIPITLLNGFTLKRIRAIYSRTLQQYEKRL
jgi:hypothetical protein